MYCVTNVSESICENARLVLSFKKVFYHLLPDRLFRLRISKIERTLRGGIKKFVH